MEVYSCVYFTPSCLPLATQGKLRPLRSGTMSLKYEKEKYECGFLLLILVFGIGAEGGGRLASSYTSASY